MGWTIEERSSPSQGFLPFRGDAFGWSSHYRRDPGGGRHDRGDRVRPRRPRARGPRDNLRVSVVADRRGPTEPPPSLEPRAPTAGAKGAAKPPERKRRRRLGGLTLAALGAIAVGGALYATRSPRAKASCNWGTARRFGFPTSRPCPRSGQGLFPSPKARSVIRATRREHTAISTAHTGTREQTIAEMAIWMRNGVQTSRPGCGAKRGLPSLMSTGTATSTPLRPAFTSGVSRRGRGTPWGRATCPYPATWPFTDSTSATWSPPTWRSSLVTSLVTEGRRPSTATATSPVSAWSRSELMSTWPTPIQGAPRCRATFPPALRPPVQTPAGEHMSSAPAHVSCTRISRTVILLVHVRGILLVHMRGPGPVPHAADDH